MAGHSRSWNSPAVSYIEWPEYQARCGTVELLYMCTSMQSVMNVSFKKYAEQTRNINYSVIASYKYLVIVPFIPLVTYTYNGYVYKNLFIFCMQLTIRTGTEH